MVGYPKWLNSKQDYLYVREYFTKEQWEPTYRALLEERMQWLNVDMLESEAQGITDETHKVVVVGGEDDGTPMQYYQYEYKEDPNCKLYKLGFTVREVEQLIKDECGEKEC